MPSSVILTKKMTPVSARSLSGMRQFSTATSKHCSQRSLAYLTWFGVFFKWLEASIPSGIKTCCFGQFDYFMVGIVTSKFRRFPGVICTDRQLCKLQPFTYVKQSCHLILSFTCTTRKPSAQFKMLWGASYPQICGFLTESLLMFESSVDYTAPCISLYFALMWYF